MTTNVPQDNSAIQYVILTGPGRSGTTWLGQIMNTYEHCMYKYEPFLPKKKTLYQQWKKDLESENLDINELRSRFKAICSDCDHQVDMPPFLNKTFRKQNPKLLYLLYGIGNKLEPVKSVYQWYGKSRVTQATPVLIKDVNFPNETLPRLCEVLEPHLIAMVRNPFGQIASYFKGVELGMFQAKDKEKQLASLRQSIEIFKLNYLLQFLEETEELSQAKLEAIRWCVQIEPLVEYARKYEKGTVIVYEDLCANPLEESERLFKFVGWPMSSTTKEFISQSTSGEKQSNKDSKNYYSVYRDPSKSLSKWKTQLTESQITDIATVIRESPVKSLWSDLPL